MRATAVLIGVVLSAAPGRADEHFVTLFTAESVPFESTKTHTFVALHRVAGGAVEAQAISWLPASRKVRGLTLRPEPGANLSLEETFQFCRENGMRVSVWGPFRVKPELYQLLVCQKEKLESGRVRYKPTDTAFPSDLACNCYHALWRPVAPLRKYAGPFNCGDATGPVTIRLYGPWIEGRCERHGAILELAVPKGEAVVRRAVDERPTRLDAVRSAVGK